MARDHREQGEVKAGLGALGVLVLALGCCGGLPILIAVVAAAGTAGLIGGGVALGVAAAIGLTVVLARAARRRKAARCLPTRDALERRN